jgi:hypothetical protein
MSLPAPYFRRLFHLISGSPRIVRVLSDGQVDQVVNKKDLTGLKKPVRS